MPASLFLALKYLRPKLSLFTIITAISITGVALGIMILIVTMAIMTGFGEMWRSKLMQFHSHIVVIGPDLREDDDLLLGTLRGQPGVQAIAPAIKDLVVIDHLGLRRAPVVKGIDPVLEIETSTLNDNLSGGITNLLELGPEEVILGSELARSIGAVPGDIIEVYIPKSFSDPNTQRLPEELYVAGTFSFGMMMIDDNFMVTDLDTARELADMSEGITEIVVQIDDPMRAVSVAEDLQARLGRPYQVRNWIHDNWHTFAALQTEKEVMFFLLLLVAVVGGFCMVCCLLIITVQKTRDIGLLKSMGYQITYIVGTFTIMGFVLGLIGVLLGLAGGLLIIRFRKPLMDGISRLRGTEVFPQEIYQFDTLPASVVAADVMTICVAGFLICILAGSIASLPAVFLRPVVALRHD